MNGVIIGKFYPLHQGHIHLIQTALDQCDEVTVCVFGSRFEMDLSAVVRGNAITADVPRDDSDRNKLVVKTTDTCPSDPYDEVTWAWWCKTTMRLAPRADTLFSSEDYGLEFANRMGMSHVMVDRDRVIVPVSGTDCRTKPLKYWDQISPWLRKYFVTKIAIVGAESTGKTTLAKRLADHYATSWVPETGRLLLEAKGAGTGKELCTEADLMEIAAAHIAAEQEIIRCSPRGLVFSDTDLMVTSAFAHYYFGDSEVSSSIGELASQEAHTYALHFLCSTEVKWEQDGTRDCTQKDREWFNARYEAEMRWRKQPYIALPADAEVAFAIAKLEIDKLIGLK